jgi:hypothetical protein
VSEGASRIVRGAVAEARRLVRALSFVFELMPMLPSRLPERLRPVPVRERVVFPVGARAASADLFTPGRGAGHPGVVLCLGVVPAGLEHPQIPRFASALARAGFVTLIVWSPAMQDRRLDADDPDRLAAAFGYLLGLPGVDPDRCGFVGTCVGASLALVAATRPAIRDRVAFVAAFAPFSSAELLLRDVSSRSRVVGGTRRPWLVDPLTWQVFLRTLTASLAPAERDLLRDEFATPLARGEQPQPGPLGEDRVAVRRLLAGVPFETSEAELADLPDELREQLGRLSPLAALANLRAPVVAIGHDRDDLVIPVEESRRLWRALAGRPGVRYTEFALFEHADPGKRRLPPWRLARELVRFVRFVFPIFGA